MMANRLPGVLLLTLAAGACASAPPAPPPVVPYEDKLAWILRLEDQRVLRDPAPAPVAPVDRRVAGSPPPVADLLGLLGDADARVRRRAAVAVGRVGLSDGVGPLERLLRTDADTDVRQMAAFALGILGDPEAAPALAEMLDDHDMRVRGRAAEALGLLGAEANAPEIGRLVAAVVAGGRVAEVAIDELAHPLDAEVEAFRLGLYALVRMKAWDPFAAAVLDERGEPRVRWWPVAYALGRFEDPRAATALLTLVRAGGTDTTAFAARGLGRRKESRAVEPLIELLAPDRVPARVIVEAIRALGAIGDSRAETPLVNLLGHEGLDANLRLEAVSALGLLRASGPELREWLYDLVGDPWPVMRAAALRALAAADRQDFLVVLSGLDPDRDWRVRSEVARLIVDSDPRTAGPQLVRMLEDPDQRVVPTVLSLLVRLGGPGVDGLLRKHLAVEDVVVRATAARLAGEARVPGLEDALDAAYRSGRADASYVARAAALGARARYGGDGARTLLVEALGDADWAVRRRAAELLREVDAGADVSGIRPAPTPREAGGYRGSWLVAPPYSPQAYIETSKGNIQIELAVLDAPLTVDNFVTLARRGYFDGLTFHRVVPNFVVQGGDPRSDGEGGPGYTIRDELNPLPYLRGTVGMALDWADTGGSQFFITHGPQPHLDARYTVFGRVVAGQDVVDRLGQGDRIDRVAIWDGVVSPGAPLP
jgi:cyclophilin family peptidyl-prolyl cis-trans isomerase/HEAT repeat protein